MKIKVTKDGPYEVTGGVPISLVKVKVDEDGNSIGWEVEKELEVKDRYFLCRCGKSENKPFCDGHHVATGFDGTETADNIPYEEKAHIFSGEDVSLIDCKEYCAGARFCDIAETTWRMIKHGEMDELSIKTACNCPSGRLNIVKDGKVLEPELEKGIYIVYDVAADALGPIFVRGGIEVESTNGRIYEVRNRMTLCRCGRSENKPFCDGHHLRT